EHGEVADHLPEPGCCHCGQGRLFAQLGPTVEHIAQPLCQLPVTSGAATPEGEVDRVQDEEVARCSLLGSGIVPPAVPGRPRPIGDEVDEAVQRAPAHVRCRLYAVPGGCPDAQWISW